MARRNYVTVTPCMTLSQNDDHFAGHLRRAALCDTEPLVINQFSGPVEAIG